MQGQKNTSVPEIYFGPKQFLVRHIAFLASKKAGDMALKG